MATTATPTLEHLSIADKRHHSASLDSGPNSEYATPLEEPSETATLQSTQPSTVASTAASSSTASDIDPPKGPLRTPFPKPLASCKPVERPPLTKDQAAKYEQIFNRVSNWEKLPVSTQKRSAEESLSESERFWLTRECLLRYLRATNWNVENSMKRLQDTLVWRREYKVEQITGELVSEESETGKQHILGYDINARPCLYMNPGKQNTKKSERQIQHLVFMLERVIDMMPPGQETSALLINFRGATGGGSPSVGQGRQVLGILQGHYPERLGRACIAECE